MQSATAISAATPGRRPLNVLPTEQQTEEPIGLPRQLPDRTAGDESLPDTRPTPSWVRKYLVGLAIDQGLTTPPASSGSANPLTLLASIALERGGSEGQPEPRHERLGSGWSPLAAEPLPVLPRLLVQEADRRRLQGESRLRQVSFLSDAKRPRIEVRQLFSVPLAGSADQALPHIHELQAPGSTRLPGFQLIVSGGRERSRTSVSSTALGGGRLRAGSTAGASETRSQRNSLVNIEVIDATHPRMTGKIGKTLKWTTVDDDAIIFYKETLNYSWKDIARLISLRHTWQAIQMRYLRCLKDRNAAWTPAEEEKLHAALLGDWEARWKRVLVALGPAFTVERCMNKVQDMVGKLDLVKGDRGMLLRYAQDGGEQAVESAVESAVDPAVESAVESTVESTVEPTVESVANPPDTPPKTNTSAAQDSPLADNH